MIRPGFIAGLGVCLGFSNAGLAQSMRELCDQQLSGFVRRNTAAPFGAADEPFFRGGALQVPTNPNVQMTRSEDGSTTTLILNRVPTLAGPQGGEIVNSRQEVIVRRLPDSTLQLNRRFLGDTGPRDGIRGAEVVFDDRQGRCDMVQFVVDQRVGERSGRVVTFDQKYCKSAQSILAKAGQAKAKECGSMMVDLASAWRERTLELQREGKFLTDIQMGSGGFAVVPPVQSNAFSMMYLMTACAPPDFADLQREMATHAQRLMAPAPAGSGTRNGSTSP